MTVFVRIILGSIFNNYYAADLFNTGWNGNFLLMVGILLYSIVFSHLRAPVIHLLILAGNHFFPSAHFSVELFEKRKHEVLARKRDEVDNQRRFAIKAKLKELSQRSFNELSEFG